MAKYQDWITPEGLSLVQGWARDGLTDEQIAGNMGINVATLYRWKIQFCEICEALKKGKEVADREVENALYKRACGYVTTDTTKERISDSGQKARHGGDVQLTEKEWMFAVKYFNFRCAYCGDYTNRPTKDHIKPLIDGGKLERQNVVPACLRCNSSKKDEEMLSWYQKQPFYDPARAQKISDYIAFVASLNDETGDQMVITKEVTKEVPPDVTAAIFWLKNRKPEQWRDGKNLELSGKVVPSGDFEIVIENAEPEPDLFPE